MGTTSRDLWHLAFVNLVRARAPASISVQPEVVLTIEPQRADMLLLRRGPPLGGGYSRIEGPVYATYLVVTDEVTEAEQDEFLAIFSHRRVLSLAAKQWMTHWIEQEHGTMQNVKDMEGYDEMMQKFIDSLPVERRLAGLAPEERLAGLAPEQRLADLPPERQVLAFSDEVLRILPDEYLRTLPADVQAAVRARIGRP